MLDLRLPPPLMLDLRLLQSPPPPPPLLLSISPPPPERLLLQSPPPLLRPPMLLGLHPRPLLRCALLLPPAHTLSISRAHTHTHTHPQVVSPPATSAEPSNTITSLSSSHHPPSLTREPCCHVLTHNHTHPPSLPRDARRDHMPQWRPRARLLRRLPGSHP
jgi:hypothetical protein